MRQPPLAFSDTSFRNFRMSISRLIRGLCVLPALLLAGCNMVLLQPPGAVAAQQGHLIVQSTVLMLLIVIPVMALTVFFAWRYRQSNQLSRPLGN